MPEDLKTLMHETADLDFAAPDLAAITRAGDRTVRRRRAATGVAGLAALAVAAAGVTALVGAGGGDSHVAARGTAPVAGVTWATGSVLHTEDGSFDLGHPVKSYVRTAVGYAFTDGDGHVYSYVDGAVERIGATVTRHDRLVTDPEGSLVGWVDPSGERPAFVVHDLATGATKRYDDHTAGHTGTLADEADPAYFYAIDGRTAYWLDDRGAVAVDVTTDRAEVVDPDARNGFDIVGVEDGLLAFPGDAGLGLGQRPGESKWTLPGAYTSIALFSPDGRWLSLEGDQLAVYDTRTREQVPVDAGSRYFTAGYEWLDDDTLATLRLRDEDASLELLTCEIPAGTCTVVASDLGTEEELEDGFALPTGTSVEE